MSTATDELPALNVDAPAPPVVHGYGLTDRGRARETNEDHFLVAELARTLWARQTSLDQPDEMHGRSRGHVLLVADGMGGHRAGEVASAMAVASIEEYVLHLLRRFSHLKASEEQSVLREFQTALTQADERLVAEGTANPECAGMGATATLAFVSGWRMYVAHAGDSRCYLYRNGSLQQLTEDHTVAAEMARRGMIAPADVAANPFRHVVTNVLGGGKAGVRADVSRQDLEPGDVALLCSDGLTDMLSDDRIAAVLAAEEDPQAACERLVEEANAAGGKDNVTAVVARFTTA